MKPLTIPTDALHAWCQIAPPGTFVRPRADGSTVTQLLDNAAFEQLITAFNKNARDVLLDFEHSSETTADSRAAGWISRMRIKNKFLEALIHFTSEGAASVCDRSLRYLSPVWDIGPDNRPLELCSAGLTNVPYFTQLRPVLNKADGAQPTTPTKGKAMQELAILFGLAEDASEAEIVAAIKKYKEDNEAKAVAEEADQVAVANSAKIANKAAFVKAYIANKEVALATLGAVKGPVAAAPVCNTADARQPSFAVTGTKTLNRADFKTQLAALPPSGRQKYYDDNITNVID